MKLSLLFLLVCFLGSVAMPIFSGVDLMALKKQEEERRKKLAKSKVAVNDTNVNSISTGGKQYGFVQMESDKPPAAVEETSPEAGEEEESPDKQPDYWKKQKYDLEQKIVGFKADIESAQLELNKLWSDFYIKSIASEQQAIRDQIAQKTDEMEQKKLSLKESEEQLGSLYEKARKAGVPPGWLR